MANVLYVAAAIAIGACVALQPPINAVMARTLGSPLMAASISIAISLALVLIASLAAGGASGELAQVGALPWWVVLGGAVGVLFVVGVVVVAPVLVIALFFVCVVAGQVLGSALADHVGAFGMAVKPLNATKLLGILLVIAGAALVRGGNS